MIRHFQTIKSKDKPYGRAACDETNWFHQTELTRLLSFVNCGRCKRTRAYRYALRRSKQMQREREQVKR